VKGQEEVTPNEGDSRKQEEVHLHDLSHLFAEQPYGPRILLYGQERKHTLDKGMRMQ
jgi:hypothetical protein